MGQSPFREKYEQAQTEIVDLKFKLVAAQNEVKQARREERVRIARELLKEEGE